MSLRRKAPTHGGACGQAVTERSNAGICAGCLMALGIRRECFAREIILTLA